MSIDIRNKKILFLGYGAVAKCIWNYFDKYFTFNRRRIVLVDKTKSAFTGPNLKGVKKIVMTVDSTNFQDLIDRIKLKKHDVIIDLTTSTVTYYFIKMCFIHGFHYINTSIEDGNDAMMGTSIDCQQHMIESIASKFPHPTSTILTEFGQNPGLVQHYILYALHEMKKLSKKSGKDKEYKDDKDDKTYSREVLKSVIDEFKVGTIFISEIDKMTMDSSSEPLEPGIIYNTWSVSGYVFEAKDKTELVCGKKNDFVHPNIPSEKFSDITMSIYDELRGTSQPYDVLFLKKPGLQTTLNSVCPILDENGDIVITNYRGKLVHHGEMFNMARYFGDNAPFMSYVYQSSPYVDQSIQTFQERNNANNDDLWLYVNQNKTFHVFKGNEVSGHDSVGCTLFCGDKSVERIFWCGSILSTSDSCVDKEYTPTVVQVAAAVLSGLSAILAPGNKYKGWIESTDLDTRYILEKSIPLLGKFLFMEIPASEFKGPIEYKEI
jgi:homospermidine synthase